ncbi:CDP-diacylglycerol diphosphatase [Rhizobium rhododendri]|uniref:CDP-diacylglycerol pyrophosphatase n=1 Tax=Rhizobium rhododendri TaxID=2506430 RepID=A0ABY8IPU3_9HYPH|nr:CDP-diacylglycerol diphosphatase [Rhizobium rhododendri]WFS25188.1 CDP-diacylglycerol diphosphatase [Rhizobium rhododendri]
MLDTQDFALFMNYRRFFLSASIVVVAVLTSSFASRSALGLVIDSCRFNLSVTGSTFPCLKIVQSPRPLAAYAILREPTHKERTILTPLDAISGIEDPRLMVTNGPNYFDDAWKERSIILDAYPQKDEWLDAALAINAATNRTQDQLHIHIGCVSTRFKFALNGKKDEIDDLSFRKIRTNTPWRSFWVKFYAADNLSDINPFHIVAEDVPGARENMQDIAIGIVGGSSRSGQRGFYILAQLVGDRGFQGSAEDLLDPKCRR